MSAHDNTAVVTKGLEQELAATTALFTEGKLRTCSAAWNRFQRLHTNAAKLKDAGHPHLWEIMAKLALMHAASIVQAPTWDQLLNDRAKDLIPIIDQLTNNSFLNMRKLQLLAYLAPLERFLGNPFRAVAAAARAQEFSLVIGVSPIVEGSLWLLCAEQDVGTRRQSLLKALKVFRGFARHQEAALQELRTRNRLIKHYNQWLWYLPHSLWQTARTRRLFARLNSMGVPEGRQAVAVTTKILPFMLSFND